MSTFTVESPNKDFTGITAGVKFKNGKAVTDNENAIAWFRRHNYKVTEGGTIPTMPHPSVVPDTFGRAPKSRDAAVLGKDAAGPLSDAFLPPIGAGEGKDPHGPEVVAPGLHAVPPAPVAGGEVSTDPETQEAKETEVAKAALVDNEPVADGADFQAPESTDGGEKPAKTAKKAKKGNG